MLREAQVVGVCGPAPTNQARLFGHELDVLLVTKAAWLRMDQPALVNAVGINCPCGLLTGPRDQRQSGGCSSSDQLPKLRNDNERRYVCILAFNAAF